MRKMLATAVALAPLAIACGAQAEVVVSTERTTPITTATATGSAPDDIRFASGGSIRLSSGVAVTLNSNNSVDLDPGSSIVMANAADGATGILAQGGNTGDITVGGNITITDNVETATDTDSDGDFDGPFVSGSDRYAVRVTGADAFVGDILFETTSNIRVEGDDSYGLSIESPLEGDLRTRGGINVTGTDSYGIRTTGDIDGDVRIGGTVGVLGDGATAVAFDSDISGSLVIEGGITATGYRYTQRPLTAEARAKLDADDLLQGGSAVRIAGDVEGGVLVNRRPVIVENDDDEDEDENADNDGDGVPDREEATATISVAGGSPAILVGSETEDITLGAVGEDDAAFGFINQGTVSADGVYDDVSSSAIVFGGQGGAVTLEGGFRNEGTISARAYDADATGIRFADGVVAPQIVNTGTASAAITGEDGNATVYQIDTGANVTAFENSGTMIATAIGENVDAFGLVDASGAITSVTNTGVIRTIGGSTDPDVTYAGATVAVDLSANTTGVTVTQFGIDDGDDDDDDATDDPDVDGDGVDDADEPSITGDVRFGSGADVFNVQNGTVTGAISFGDGADSLSITGGASVSGVLSDSDGLLDIAVTNGTLDARQAGQVDVTGLTVGADGDLIVAIDPLAGTAGGFRVNGTATLADGAGLGVRFDSLLLEDERFVIIDADTLSYGDIDTDSLAENSPYVFVATAGADIPAGQVYVDVRRRTSEEMGLIDSEAAALDSVYFALDDNEDIMNAFLSQTDRDGFINLYEQMLPDHSGGPLMSLATGVDAVTRALIGRNQTAAKGETSAWIQEINFYAEKDTDQAYGFESEGFGVAAGIERGTANGAFGLSFAFTSSDLEDPESEAEEVLSANLVELGLYWRAQGEKWTTWARAAAGYAYFDSTRQLVGPGIFRSTEADWNGYSLTAAGGVSYETHMGKWYIRGDAMAEYFGLNEGSREESGGGDGFDLAIEDREGHLLSATAAVSIGRTFGREGWIRPEIRFGYRQNISFDAGETIARFVSGGDPFTLQADTIEGGGPILGFRLNVGNDLGHLALEADAEMIDDYIRYAILLRASFRF